MHTVNYPKEIMPLATIFDVDGTLVDSVDLHAIAWQQALAKFGHDVTFERVRHQIGKGGDQLIPTFLTESQQQDHGEAMAVWRGNLFATEYLPLVRPFSAVPELLRRVKNAGLMIGIASSARKKELEVLLNIAGVADLIDVVTSSEDVERSKPAPDVFQVALSKLSLAASQAVAIGDTPYDAQAASQAGIPTIGVLCGGFTEDELRTAGCIAVYPGPGALWAGFQTSPLWRNSERPREARV